MTYRVPIAETLHAEALARGLPEAWAVDIVLKAGSLAQGRALIEDRFGWHMVAKIANEGEIRERYDMEQTVRNCWAAGMTVDQFKAAIVAKRASLDQHIDTARRTHPADRLSSHGAMNAMDQLSREFWAKRKAEQEATDEAA